VLTSRDDQFAPRHGAEMGISRIGEETGILSVKVASPRVIARGRMLGQPPSREAIEEPDVIVDRSRLRLGHATKAYELVLPYTDRQTHSSNEQSTHRYPSNGNTEDSAPDPHPRVSMSGSPGRAPTSRRSTDGLARVSRQRGRRSVGEGMTRGRW
jgi:hypothetical protein